MPNSTPDASLRAIRQVPGNCAAIIFVHGFAGDIVDTWQQFPKFLAQTPQLSGWDIWLLGYSTHLAIDVLGVWAADPGLDKLAARVVTDMQLGALAGYGSVAFVAHSMGGLVTQRALLNAPDLARRTSHVLLYGTPSGGLKKATLGWLLKPQLRHMSAGGAFVTTLRQDWQARFGEPGAMPFQFRAVAGERDEFVPADSALGPFRAPPFADCTAVVPGTHTSMVKPASADAACVQVAVRALTRSAVGHSASDAASLAVELSQFQQAIDRWLPHAAELDKRARVQLAIALDRVGRRQDAIQLLREANTTRSHTDAMGTLAGRLKRRWLASNIEADGREALALYSQALALSRAAKEFGQCHYHGINVAFLQLALDDQLVVARATATQVLQDCEAAEAAGLEKGDDTLWRQATEAEAMLLLGRTDEARDRYRDLIVHGKPEPWQRDSMHLQAVHLAHLLGRESLQKEVDAWIR